MRAVYPIYGLDTPAGAASSGADLFTEPGIGGRSTYVVAEKEYIATPQVRYDSHLRQFILVYQVEDDLEQPVRPPHAASLRPDRGRR